MKKIFRLMITMNIINAHFGQYPKTKVDVVENYYLYWLIHRLEDENSQKKTGYKE